MRGPLLRVAGMVVGMVCTGEGVYTCFEDGACYAADAGRCERAPRVLCNRDPCTVGSPCAPGERCEASTCGGCHAVCFPPLTAGGVCRRGAFNTTGYIMNRAHECPHPSKCAPELNEPAASGDVNWRCQEAYPPLEPGLLDLGDACGGGDTSDDVMCPTGYSCTPIAGPPVVGGAVVSTCEADPYGCEDPAAVWSPEQRAWCCKYRHLGCGVSGGRCPRASECYNPVVEKCGDYGVAECVGVDACATMRCALGTVCRVDACGGCHAVCAVPYDCDVRELSGLLREKQEWCCDHQRKFCEEQTAAMVPQPCREEAQCYDVEAGRCGMFPSARCGVDPCATALCPTGTRCFAGTCGTCYAICRPLQLGETCRDPDSAPPADDPCAAGLACTGTTTTFPSHQVWTCSNTSTDFPAVAIILIVLGCIATVVVVTFFACLCLECLKQPAAPATRPSTGWRVDPLPLEPHVGPDQDQEKGKVTVDNA